MAQSISGPVPDANDFRVDVAQVGRARAETKWRNGLSRKNMHLDPTVKKAEERLIEYLKEVG